MLSRIAVHFFSPLTLTLEPLNIEPSLNGLNVLNYLNSASYNSIFFPSPRRTASSYSQAAKIMSP